MDGHVLAAAQEERFTRKKHDASFPTHAVAYCLKEAGLRAEDLDIVAFYDKPLKTFDRLLETYLAFAPRGLGSFFKAIPTWLKQKLNIHGEIAKAVPGDYQMLFCEHHQSHAASAFFASPFEEAAILTADGVGEWAATSWGVGSGNTLTTRAEIHFPHSLGLLYSAFTYFTGFKVNSGEYKLMGLAPYGRPIYADVIREHLITVHDDGSFELDMRYFDYCVGLKMTNQRFADLFGGPARAPEQQITQREMDLAASVQLVTEEVMLKLATHIHKETGLKQLCMAGGVALNCVANGRLLREGPYDDIFIQPAAGDAGGALGAALFAWHGYLDKPRTPVQPDGQQGSLLGPAFDDDAIQAVLMRHDAVAEYLSEEERNQRLVDLMQDGAVVGLFQGRMEYGPRALGNRSIIADPRNREMQKQLNLKIKFRESFRPFAPIVLEERARDYFDLERPSPYMLLVGHVVPERRTQPDAAQVDAQGLDLLNQIRSDIPAVTHVDYSARVQTVDAVRNPSLHKLMKTWETVTGCPVLVNTSFNVRGEPIVCTPEDAWRCFMATHMDVLVLGNHLLLKKNQKEWQGSEQHLASFALD